MLKKQFPGVELQILVNLQRSLEKENYSARSVYAFRKSLQRVRILVRFLTSQDLPPELLKPRIVMLRTNQGVIYRRLSFSLIKLSGLLRKLSQILGALRDTDNQILFTIENRKAKGLRKILQKEQPDAVQALAAERMPFLSLKRNADCQVLKHFLGKNWQKIQAALGEVSILLGSFGSAAQGIRQQALWSFSQQLLGQLNRRVKALRQARRRYKKLNAQALFHRTHACRKAAKRLRYWNEVLQSMSSGLPKLRLIKSSRAFARGIRQIGANLDFVLLESRLQAVLKAGHLEKHP